MSRKNRGTLADRVTRAAEASLAAQHSVSPLCVFVGIGWLDGGTARRWRQGQIECLEETLQTHPSRISEAMQLLRSWAVGKGLSASETDYVARTPQRQALRFSRSGDPAVEQLYRTHWISSELSEKRRERLAEKASRAPDLVVILPLNTEWTCHLLRRHRRSSHHGKTRAGVPALRRSRRSRVPLRRRRVAHAPGQGEERATCRRGALQQEPPPLRAARPAGRAAGPGRRATRARRGEAGVVRSRGPGSRSFPSRSSQSSPPSASLAISAHGRPMERRQLCEATMATGRKAKLDVCQ